MEIELEKLFLMNKLPLDFDGFQTAKVVGNVEYSQKQKKYFLKLLINKLWPIEILKTVETSLLNNPEVPVTLSFMLQEEDYTLTDIFVYLNYIRLTWANIKEGIFETLNTDKVKFNQETKELIILVKTLAEQKLIEQHCLFYQTNLVRYGFKSLIIKTELIMQENDIWTINQEKVSQYQMTNQHQTATHNSVNPHSSPAKYNNYKSAHGNTIDKISSIDQDFPNIALQGKVIKINKILTSNKIYVYSLILTDESDSIGAKFFSREEKGNMELDNLELNSWITAYGDIRFDSFSNDQVLFIRRFTLLEKQQNSRMDNEEKKRVELHLHTKMSVMDGVVDLKELFKLLRQWKHSAVAITDHLNVQAYPDLYNLAKLYPEIKVIYGIEFDMIEDKINYVKNTHHHNLREAKYVVFDLETTGLSAQYDEIIEFGAVIMDGISGERKIVNHLFKPSKAISLFTTELTGITNEMLADKKPFAQEVETLLEYFQDAILIAHNAEFDMGFLQSWLAKLGYPPLSNTVIDTLQLARALQPGLKNYRLGTVARKYDVTYNEEVAHRGDYDAEVLANIFECQFRDLVTAVDAVYDSDINNVHQVNIYNKIRPFHVIALAKNQQGIKDLFKLVTISHTKQYYNSPKLLRSTLNEYRENLLIGSSCVDNEIFEVACNKTQAELEKLMQWYDYIEIQPLDVYQHLLQTGDLTEERLIIVLKAIINTAKKIGKLVVATGDVHYLNPQDKIFREVYIHTKGLGGRAHPLFDYKGRIHNYPDQFLRTTLEMKTALQFLEDNKLIHEITVTNPNLLAEQITKVEIIKNKLYPPKIEGSDQMLTDVCYQNAHKIYGKNLPVIVKERLEKELSAIIKHGFSVVYWISHKLVEKSLNDGYLVGSRGSVGSSLVATLSNITEVNPLPPHYLCQFCQYSEFTAPGTVKCGFDLPLKNCPNCQKLLTGQGHDIPFETFLGFEADKVPDIDLNFSGEYQPIAHDFTKEMFGEQNVFRAGTISTVAEKTAFGYVKGFFESYNAGANKRKVEIERIAKGCEGVKRTTGQHPGGIVVIPKEYCVEDFTPVNYPADDNNSMWLTTHFDFHAIHDNVLKLDILGHVDPTALRMLQDLTGIDPKTIPTNNKEVLQLFCGLESLKISPKDINGELTGAIGIPEFGTGFVRKMLLETNPQSFADLVQISGLSHGTDVWVGNAQDLIKNKMASISEVIGCRDDIMVTLLYKGLPPKMAFKIMEDVRKGRGLTEEYIELMHKYNIEQWYIDSCNKIKYMFPKAHATAYVLMAWRVAWYKINYPLEYYATFFSTRTDVFDIKSLIQGPLLIKKVLNDIQRRNDSKRFEDKLTPKEKDLIPFYEVSLEMFARGYKVCNISLSESDATKFKIIVNENQERVILPPFTAIDGLGISVAESIVAARQEKTFGSLTDLKKRTIVTKAHIAAFEELGLLNDMWQSDQITFEF